MVGKYILAGLIFSTSAVYASTEQVLFTLNSSVISPDWDAKIDLGLYSLAWSPDGELLAVGGRGTIWIYRMPRFVLERSFATSHEEIWGLAWSPDGSLLASAGKDGTVQFWSGGAQKKKLLQGGWVLDVAWNPDGKSLIAVDYTGLAKEWDVEGYLRASIQLDADGLGVDWSPKGRLFAVTTGHDASRVLLFDSRTAELRWRKQDVPRGYNRPFGFGLDEVNGVSYSPNARWIATAHQDGRILVRSAENGQKVFSAQLHQPGIGGARRVAWSPKGNWLVSCGEDGRVNCVDYPSGKRRFELLDTTKPVWSVGWSRNNRWLAAVGDQGEVWVWSTDFIPSSAFDHVLRSGQANPQTGEEEPASEPKKRTRRIPHVH